MEKLALINTDKFLGNCKECGVFIFVDTLEFCNDCQDAYNLNEHNGG